MYRIGIDLGGTFIKAGVVDENYRIVGTAACPTALPRPADEIIADMARMAKEAVGNAGSGVTMEEVAGVGVGSPGTCNQETGAVEYSCNLGFNNEPVCDKLGRLLGKPVHIENDANAAAYGEALAGAGKGTKDCICVTLGTGVGGGIIIDGKIYGGMNYAAGELGHTVIVMGGEPCGCGRQGCWEAYASVTGLIRQTRRAMEAHPESLMWKEAPTLEEVNGRTSFDAMRAGDPTAKEVVDQYIRYIGCGLTDMINIFQPEVLCIGGAISKEGDTLLKPLQAYVERERYSKNSERQTRICRAQLGNDAGIIGAAYLGA